MSDVQIITLLQTLDKYLIHLRKLKHLKNEAVKANLVAARERAAEILKKQSKKTLDEQAVNNSKEEKSAEATKSKSEIKKSITEEHFKHDNGTLEDAVLENASCKKSKK
jgi:uncharacterized protein YabN with tetrapyrrole methylase and pyrophosphatase domain